MVCYELHTLTASIKEKFFIFRYTKEREGGWAGEAKRGERSMRQERRVGRPSREKREGLAKE